MIVMNSLVILFVFICIVMGACATPHYMHVYESPKGLDFSEGKWLVTKLDTKVPYNYRESLNKELLEGLRELGGDSIYNIDDVRFKYINPGKLQFELTPHVLKLFKESTDFDYVVTATARKVRDDVPDLVYPSKPVYYQKSESEVCIAVYDVADGARIYCQRVIASVTLDEGDEQIVFARSAGTLLHNAMKKALKDLKKNSRIIRKMRRNSHAS